MTLRQLLPALWALLAGATAQAACGDHLPAAQRLLAEGSGLQVAFAPRPAPLVLGRHFGLDIVVCAPAGQPLPDTLAVDADMPAHRHGMNYRASVTALGDGRFRAEGLMFHMAGRWRVLFDLPGAAGAPARRISHDIDLR
ncbi:MAG: FixH family protein [Aquabacterium sp.]|nr:FixH family protein [Aquabacterium sp.]